MVLSETEFSLSWFDRLTVRAYERLLFALDLILSLSKDEVPARLR